MKYTAFFVLGLIIFITPFLGITTEWKLLITRACGAIIMFGVVLRHYYLDSLRYENQAFDEDTPEEKSTNPEPEKSEGVEEEVTEYSDDEEPQDSEEDYEDKDEELTEDDIEILEINDPEEDEDLEEGEIETDEDAYEDDDEMSNLEDRSV